MNKILDNKYPYLSNFFKTAIEQNRLFHSIILHGNNQYMQYAVALELARQLNCLEDGSEDCQCQNCKWIRANQHPAVMTISKIDNRTDVDGKEKHTISKKQTDNILNSLITSSDYHRVFIFCDAEKKELSLSEENDYQEFISTQFNLPQENNEEKKWYPTGVNKECFPVIAANSMLKTLEEPYSNATFIFLTNNKDDLISTIVSRSQAFYVSDVKEIQYDIEFITKYFNNYPNFDTNKAIEFAQTLLNYQNEKNVKPDYILNSIQYYLKELLKNNLDNRWLSNIIFKDIKEVENAKKMIKSFIKEETIYDDLAFYFADNNR